VLPGPAVIPWSCNHLLNCGFFEYFVELVPFSRVRPDIRGIEKVKGKLFIQAPIKYQPFVEEFLDGLLPEEAFLEEVSKRTGYERPEQIPWVRVVLLCRNFKKPVKLIEPDIDRVLAKAGKRLNLGEDAQRIFQEARLWFLSGSGYPRHFYVAFDALFFWCPWRVFFRKLFLRAVAFVVNLIPGDQRDVLALVNEANKVLVEELSDLLKNVKKATVILDEDIADDVKRRVAEM